MKRSWVCGCALAVGLAGVSRAGDVEWRAVGTKKAPAITPVAAQVPANAMPMPVFLDTVPTKTDLAPAQMPSAPDGPAETIAAPKSVPPDSPVVCNPLPCCETGIPVEACPIPFIAGAVVSESGNTVSDCDCKTNWRNWYKGRGVSQVWVRGEFLAWWVKSAGVPALLTTSSTPLPAIDNNVGALGRNDTVVLLGGKQLDEQFRPGARFSVGGSFDECGMRGFDASVFFTSRRDDTFTANDAQFPQLFRPFRAANAGIPGIGNQPGEYREIVYSLPAGVGGRFVADTTSFFWGADVNFRRNLYRGCTSQLDAFVGFRYLHLDEELHVREDIRVNTFNPLVGVPVGSTISISDRFRTTNDFYGGQFGADYEYKRDKWSVGVRSSVALGGTRERLSVAGSQVVTVAGAAPQAFNGGLLALNSNIGNRQDNRFAVVPETTLRVGYQFSERIKLTAGYDFLYWSNVIRPGDQIDRVLDVNRIPNFRAATPINDVRPAPLFNTTDFWAQGINFGAEYRW